MRVLLKIWKLLTDKKYRFNILASRGFYNHWSDEKYLKHKFKLEMGYDLNLNHPQTFSEKLQWLKLHDHNPLYTIMVDKEKAKEYVANIIGSKYIIPTLGVWDKFEDIDFDKLPTQFVLKTTHDSGGVFICKNKEDFDIHAARLKLEKSLKRNFYYQGREWPYKNVPPRIIAEPYLEDSQTKELRDYKFYCFNGDVDSVMVCVDRAIGDPKFYFFNEKWELLRINKRGKAAPKNFTLQKPAQMNKMFQLAANLSKSIPFVRVDLYYCNEQIYFGEMTFYPQSGFDTNTLPEEAKRRGALIKLPRKGEIE